MSRPPPNPRAPAPEISLLHAARAAASAFSNAADFQDEAARFENLVASHLLKLVHWLHDREGYAAKLYFLRDTSKREVDFLVTVDEKVWFAVEAKSQDQAVSANLRYFRDKLKIPFSYQALRKEGVDRFSDGVRVLSAGKLLAALI